MTADMEPTRSTGAVSLSQSINYHKTYTHTYTRIRQFYVCSSHNNELTYNSNVQDGPNTWQDND